MTAKEINFHRIARISAMLSVVFAAFIAFIPAILGLALGGLLAGTLFGLLAFIILFVGFFITFLIVGIVWSYIPRNIQIVLIALILVLGIVTVQPEADFVAVGALIFTALGIGPKK